MSIGLSVDYSAHICFGYMIAEGEPGEKSLQALKSLGWPVVQGAVSALLGVVALATIDSYIVQTFFKTVFLVIVFGIAHACLFLPETSCERGNRYLDRSVLVATVERADYAFFKEFAESLPQEAIVIRTDASLSPTQPKPISPEYAGVLDLCDERCKDFLESWIGKGLPLPEVGYELKDESGRICAQAELAWPEKKVAVLLPEDFAHKPDFESRGWRGFHTADLTNLESQLRPLLME